MAARARILWLTVFAIAFGFVEAAVVIYLRELFYPGGFRFPLVALPATTAGIEVVREAATLVMLWAAAALSARSGWGRFGAFALVFGVWDLAFYAALWLVLRWPESLATWDVLFLIPGIWTGPVWSAAIVAALLILCGAAIFKADDEGKVPRTSVAAWLGAAASLALLLTAFLWNHGPAIRGEVPAWFPWPVWLAGVLVGLATFGVAFARRR